MQIGGFGVIAVARSRIELVEEAIQRLRDALGYIDRDRLIVAPDCGLGMLTRDLAKGHAGIHVCRCGGRLIAHNRPEKCPVPYRAQGLVIWL